MSRVFSQLIPVLALLSCATKQQGSPEGKGAPSPAFAEGTLAGGAGTVFDTSPLAFSLALRDLPSDIRRGFAVGNAFFNDNWVTAPASTAGRDGLGPLFNARSCSSCHIRDGRGRPPKSDDEKMISTLIRLSIPGEGPHGGPVPEPNYGDQLQNHAIGDVPVEGDARLRWEMVERTTADGTPFTLKRPHIEFDALAHGPLHADVRTSVRVAPSVFGLGLIEAVPVDTLRALADPQDKNQDGISGRINEVWSPTLQRKTVGRFGWKSNVATLRDQSAGAFLGDIGITSSLHPNENHTAVQTQAADAPSGGTPELDDHKLGRITLYLQTLAVPARRDLDSPAVKRGENHFTAAGCAQCHTPTLRTGTEHSVHALRAQVIHPYSDFLLHDMGPELADGRPDFDATGNEWRTAPLWGLGLQEVVSGHMQLLHDGRANGIQEAILWHGGEAQRAREAFRAMSTEERAELEAFVRSL